MPLLAARSWLLDAVGLGRQSDRPSSSLSSDG
jgi:hypothetical protein